MTHVGGTGRLGEVHIDLGRTWARPGEVVPVRVAVPAGGARVRLTLLDLDRELSTVARRVPAEGGTAAFRVRLPGDADGATGRGYGVRAELLDRSGAVLDAAESAVEALEGWWQAPRHAALVAFRDPVATAADMRALRTWHVTVAQAYDWMWRHYRYLPPGGAPEFTDTLGRVVSLDAVRAAVRAGHAAGIATLAYGSVYGAEREHVEAHPEDRVLDADGRPLSLGETFFINDVRPGTPWRARLLDEYATAMRRIGFDGIHMDTYGPPYHGVAVDGSPVDFAAAYPSLIAEGAARVAAARPGGRVLFNCVEGFPLEAVAPAPAAALYLELWPPDERYADLVRWIDRSRAVAAGRAVVIAAYAAAMKDPAAIVEPGARAAAFEASLLTTSVIAAAGAFHHTIAAPDRLLIEGYYPAAIPMRAAERRDLAAAWAFGARYLHLLSDPRAEVVPIDDLALADGSGAAVPVSAIPQVGAVWARATRLPDGTRVVSLVDLGDQADDRWVAPGTVSRVRRGWSVRSTGVAAETVRVASPWSADGAAMAPADRGGELRLPVWRRWILLVAPAESASR